VDAAQPRPATKDALVESPLQLLCTIEAHEAGFGGAQTEVQVRADVPILARTRDALIETGLPGGILIRSRAPVTALSPVAPRDRIVGDAFSGLFQTSLLTRSTRSMVLVDDGLATLHLARLLVDSGEIVRAGVPVGGVRRRLARIAARRLLRVADGGGLTLFTALPLPSGLPGALEAKGIHVVVNRFEWLAGRALEDAPPEPTVVVGSALAANGLIDPDRYLAWVLGHAADGPVRYIPHRRSHPMVTRALAASPSVTVDESSIPIELRLSGMRSGQRILSLPSTAAVLLTTILAPRGVVVDARPVPDDWWTDLATPERRAYLQSALPLAEAARAAAERGQ
jgi:hypothetical protein